jgi:hypothetical protein
VAARGHGRRLLARFIAASKPLCLAALWPERIINIKDI